MAEVAGSSRFLMGLFYFILFYFILYGFLFRWDFGEYWVVVAWVFLGFCSDGFFWVDHQCFLGIFGGWVSNRRRGFVDQWLGIADRWLGWWVWWPLLALTGLMVCVCVALLMVYVYVCVSLLWLGCG